MIFPATFVTALALTSAIASATPLATRSVYALKETHIVPQEWSRLHRAPADHIINLNIALKQSKFEDLERHAYEVSDPSHPRYGKHLTSEEVADLVRPTTDTSRLVHEWLLEHGIHTGQLDYSTARDWIRVSLPVKDVERLLQTEYSVYKHEDGDHLVRTPEWSLPIHLHDHIKTIQPTNSFMRAAPVSVGVTPVWADHGKGYKHMPWQNYPNYQNPNVSAVCNVSSVTPLCLRTLYGTINYVPQAAGKNKIALTDYLGEANNRSDIGLFLQQFRPDATAYAQQFPVVVINGGDNQQTPDTPAQLAAGKDVEGNLDAETVIGITYPTPLIAYTTGGSPPFIPDLNTPTDTNEPYLTWLSYVLAQTDLPQVVSNSYQDDERTVPYSFATTVCSEFAQLAARGVTVFFGSGDYGVGYNGTCFSNDGKNTSQFTANFPSSCQYVTSVGATKNFNPEVVAYDASNGFASGGGFSNYFPRPAFQNRVVPAYIASLGDEFAGLYNTSGRAFPDLAAQGERYVTVWDGSNVLVDGTSASTPTTSSVFALVNDALIAAGRPPLGWLNPWLYSRGYRAFNDVTMGSAVGCDGPGFPAEVGWDAVTGFGTPDTGNSGIGTPWTWWQVELTINAVPGFGTPNCVRILGILGLEHHGHGGG